MLMNMCPPKFDIYQGYCSLILLQIVRVTQTFDALLFAPNLTMCLCFFSVFPNIYAFPNI